MKGLKIAVLLVFSGVLFGTAQAQTTDGLGVGIILGEPTGLGLKKWLGNDRAIDAGVAWSFSENESLHVHVDYLFHRFDVLTAAVPGRLPVHFGIGGRLKFKDDDEKKKRNSDDNLIGIRVPLGVSYLFASAPIDLFAEIVPVLDVAPDTDFDLNAAIGVRYYF